MDGWRVRKSDDLFWASVIINEIHDEEGRAAGFAKVTRDLTERRTMEEQLRQVQKMEAIGQLTGGIAHDFNNLLTVISGNIETVQRRMSRTDPGLYRNLEAAARAVERASTLTHRLLAYSRRQPLEPKPPDYGDVGSARSHHWRNITIETVWAGELWQVSAACDQASHTVVIAVVTPAPSNRRSREHGPGHPCQTG